MKKRMVFAVMVMAAGFAGAQTLSWIGESGVYDVDHATWYNASGSFGTSAFRDQDFHQVATLTLGGYAQTWWTDDVSHPPTSVTMYYKVDALASQTESLGHVQFTDPNDEWANLTGIDIIAAYGGGGVIGGGAHTVRVWFTAESTSMTVYDMNDPNPYTADFQTAPIPEPATMGLLGLGALALVLRRKMSL